MFTRSVRLLVLPLACLGACQPSVGGEASARQLVAAEAAPSAATCVEVHVSSVPDRIFVPSPTPHWLARSGDLLLMSGPDYIGQRTGSFAVLSTQTGGLLKPFPEVSAGPVTAMVGDEAGGRYLAGTFDRINRVLHGNLAHVRADGTVADDFRVTLSAEARGVDIRALAVMGDALLIGGTFDHVNGVERLNFAAVNRASGQLLELNPGAVGTVRALLVTETSIYTGGNGGLSAIDRGDGSRTTVFAETSVPGGTSAPVIHSLAVAGDTLFVAGNFRTFGGKSIRNLISYDLGTGVFSDWNPEVSNTVEKVVVFGDRLYVGGTFESVAGQARQGIASFQLPSLGLLDWKATFGFSNTSNRFIYDILPTSDAVYVAGRFQSVNGVGRRFLAALDARVSERTLPWKADANSEVRALALSGERLSAAGSFVSIAGRQRRALAALDVKTRRATAWYPRVDGPVDLMTSDAGRAYLHGYFDRGPGKPPLRYAAVSVETGALLDWTPPAPDAPNVMVADAGVVYVGAHSGFDQSNIATFDGQSGEPLPWQADLPSTGLSELISTPDALVGLGYNSTTGKFSRLFVIDRATGASRELNHRFRDATRHDVDLRQLAVVGQKLFFLGDFTAIDGVPRSKIAGVDLLTNQLLDFAPSFDFSPAFDGSVSALASDGCRLFLGGSFSKVEGASRRQLAAFDVAANTLLPWLPPTLGPSSSPPPIYGIRADSDYVHVTGEFTQLGTVDALGLAQFAVTAAR